MQRVFGRFASVVGVAAVVVLSAFAAPSPVSGFEGRMYGFTGYGQAHTSPLYLMGTGIEAGQQTDVLVTFFPGGPDLAHEYTGTISWQLSWVCGPYRPASVSGTWSGSMGGGRMIVVDSNGNAPSVRLLPASYARSCELQLSVTGPPDGTATVTGDIVTGTPSFLDQTMPPSWPTAQPTISAEPTENPSASPSATPSASTSLPPLASGYVWCPMPSGFIGPPLPGPSCPSASQEAGTLITCTKEFTVQNGQWTGTCEGDAPFMLVAGDELHILSMGYQATGDAPDAAHGYGVAVGLYDSDTGSALAWAGSGFQSGNGFGTGEFKTSASGQGACYLEHGDWTGPAGSKVWVPSDPNGYTGDTTGTCTSEQVITVTEGSGLFQPVIKGFSFVRADGYGVGFTVWMRVEKWEGGVSPSGSPEASGSGEPGGSAEPCYAYTYDNEPVPKLIQQEVPCPSSSGTGTGTGDGGNGHGSGVGTGPGCTWDGNPVTAPGYFACVVAAMVNALLAMPAAIVGAIGNLLAAIVGLPAAIVAGILAALVPDVGELTAIWEAAWADIGSRVPFCWLGGVGDAIAVVLDPALAAGTNVNLSLSLPVPTVQAAGGHASVQTVTHTTAIPDVSSQMGTARSFLSAFYWVLGVLIAFRMVTGFFGGRS